MGERNHGTTAEQVHADAGADVLERLRRRRHRLVVVLTFVTGCADAVGVIALGGAFSSVMTGNMVLLGLSAGATDAALAISAASAIGAYAIGVLVGAHVAGVPSPEDPVWPAPVNRALLLELAALIGFLVAWVLTLDQRPSDARQLVLLMVLAAALGVQGSAVQRFGVSGLSSTYLTGTLTNLIAGIAARRPYRSMAPSAYVLVALIVGAAVGALLVVQAPWSAPLAIVVPIAAVIGLSMISRPAVRAAWSGDAARRPS
jgi:uncharacterized membrane protein YoaK (UPF0700 family)